jgi:hypothetical protein
MILDSNFNENVDDIKNKYIDYILDEEEVICLQMERFFSKKIEEFEKLQKYFFLSLNKLKLIKFIHFLLTFY